MERWIHGRVDPWKGRSVEGWIRGRVDPWKRGSWAKEKEIS